MPGWPTPVATKHLHCSWNHRKLPFAEQWRGIVKRKAFFNSRTQSLPVKHLYLDTARWSTCWGSNHSFARNTVRCCDNTMLCKTSLHAVYHHQALAQRIKTLYFVLLGKLQLKNGKNKPCVHWMDCVSMYNKICGYYNKGVCAQLIRSTDDIFESGNMVPHENVCIRKINLQKTSINHGILRRELLNYTKEL